MSRPDALGGLRDQIRAATDAAQRLVREGAAAHEGEPHPNRARPVTPPAPPKTPPAGWQQTDDAAARSELAALTQLLEVLRELLPTELEQQLTDLIRQILVLLRALIDWMLTRLEQEGGEPERVVEDIPIS